MASILNADNGVISGSAGLKMSSDTSGILNLQTNGTTAISISASQVVSFGATSSIDFAGAVSLSGGTANGVMYLNGSKVVTTGSALTFDGTNFGVGVTPSAWGGGFAVSQYKGGFVGSQSGSYFYTGQNTYLDGVNWKYIASAAVTLTEQSFGAFTWYNAASGTAGNTVSLTQRMTLDASGNLGIGTSSPNAAGWDKAVTINGSTSSALEIQVGGSRKGEFAALSGGVYMQTVGAIPIIFSTNSTERMRLDTSGNLGIGTSSPGAKLDVGGGTGSPAIRINGASASNSGPYIRFDKATTQKNLIGPYSAIISGTSDDLTYWSTTGAGHQWVVNNNASSSMTLDSSGNLGLGVTPSAWGIRAIDVGQVGTGISGSAGNANLTQGAYNDGSGWKRAQASYAVNLFNPAAGAFYWFQAASGATGSAITWTQAMTLDTSGNLGLGVTPSAWGLGKAFEVGSLGNGIWNVNGQNTSVVCNTYYQSSSYKYASTAPASSYQQAGGIHYWYIAPSGTAGNAISFTQAMTLDSSGRLMVGTTTAYGNAATFYAPNGTVVLGQGSSTGYAGLRIYNDTNSNIRALEIDYYGSAASGGERAEIFVTGAYPLLFGTGNTERARIDSSGNLLVGNASKLAGGITGIDITTGTYPGVTWGSGTSPVGYWYAYSPSSQFRSETVVGYTYAILSGGTGGVSLANGATAWAALSDERKKDLFEPISDAANKITQLRTVYGKYKTDPEDTRRAFLIAQDVQTVFPEAVDVLKDEDKTLELRYADTIPLLVAAIKELTARVAQLESK